MVVTREFGVSMGVKGGWSRTGWLEQALEGFPGRANEASRPRQRAARDSRWLPVAPRDGWSALGRDVVSLFLPFWFTACVSLLGWS